MKKLKNVHPGEVLKKDFLDEMNIAPHTLAQAIRVDPTLINSLIKGTTSMTTDTALRLSKYFGNSAYFWMGLQYDFEETLKEAGMSNPYQISL